MIAVQTYIYTKLLNIQRTLEFMWLIPIHDLKTARFSLLQFSGVDFISFIEWLVFMTFRTYQRDGSAIVVILALNFSAIF